MMSVAHIDAYHLRERALQAKAPLTIWTDERLLESVIRDCERQADTGRTAVTINFPLKSESESDFREHHKARESVVQALVKRGFEAEGTPREFNKHSLWGTDEDGEGIQTPIEHFIKISWGS